MQLSEMSKIPAKEATFYKLNIENTYMNYDFLQPQLF